MRWADAHTDTERKVLPDSAAMYCMLGKLWQSLGDSKKAVDAYVSAVKINPFLWEAFTGLCDTGRDRGGVGFFECNC